MECYETPVITVLLGPQNLKPTFFLDRIIDHLGQNSQSQGSLVETGNVSPALQGIPG